MTLAARLHFPLIAMLSLLLGTGLARAQGSFWLQQEPNGGANSAAVYDPIRNNVLLFGGAEFTRTNGETWLFDGVHWSRDLGPAPSPRYGHAMVFDSARGVVVLFGGRYYSMYGDTWEWNGATWTLRSVAGPSPRSGLAMAYDSARGVTVLFGGGSTGETWEYDGVAWTQRMVPGPAARNYHSLVYDPIRHVTVLFGGEIPVGLPSQNDFSDFGDTWEWDGTTWTQRQTPAPPGAPEPRTHHAMCFDPVRGVTLLNGGYSFTQAHSSIDYPDTWEWNGFTWTRRANNTFITASSGTLFFYPPRNAPTEFLGGDNFQTSLFLEWDGNAAVWTKRNLSAPSSRAFHAASLDTARNRTVLFGGEINGGTSTETWEFNGSAWSLVSPTGPSARYAIAMAFDAAHNKTVLFGGDTVSSPCCNAGDTWTWNGSTWTSLPITGPSARSTTMVFDAARGVIVLFGGAASGAPYGDTWTFNGSAWTQRTPAGPTPSARSNHLMAYDAARSIVVLFGGYSAASVRLNDTWTWNGAAWAQVNLAPNALVPPARSSAAMTYDPDRSVVVLSGGFTSSGYLHDIWEWNGTTWTQRGASGLAARFGHSLTYDPVAHRTMLFGGYEPSGNTYYLPTGSQTWELVLTACLADYNNDGHLSVQDIFDFLNAWFAYDLRADFNGDYRLQTQDIFDYLNAWFVGCP